MKIRAQHYILNKLDSTTAEWTETHIFAEDNCLFKKKDGGSVLGWHIQLGTLDSAENYEDILVEGESVHEVPDSYPDITLQEQEEETKVEP